MSSTHQSNEKAILDLIDRPERRSAPERDVASHSRAACLVASTIRSEPAMAIIQRVEIHEFEYEVQNLGAVGGHSKHTHNHVAYVKGSRMKLSKYAVVIETNEGARGEYVACWGATRPALTQSILLAPDLLGR